MKATRRTRQKVTGRRREGRRYVETESNSEAGRILEKSERWIDSEI